MTEFSRAVRMRILKLKMYYPYQESGEETGLTIQATNAWKSLRNLSIRFKFQQTIFGLVDEEEPILSIQPLPIMEGVFS